MNAAVDYSYDLEEDEGDTSDDGKDEVTLVYWIKCLTDIDFPSQR